MPHITEHTLAIAGLLLFAAVLVSKASARLGVPALLLFLALGMLAGSDGPGGIWFDNAAAAQSLGTVALALILFGGGLATEWSAVRGVLWRAVSLATAGVAITAVVTGAFAAWLLHIPLTEGLLIGAIVSSTDAAAVFSVLRSRRLGLKDHLGPLLELESGSNDPMAVFLTLGLTTVLASAQADFTALVPLFFKQMLFGGVIGYAAGRLARWLLNRLRLEVEGLYPVVLLALVLLIYGVTASIDGSGFLAVYIAGIILGNSEFVHKRSLTRFADALSWLMQIAMFLILGLLVFPSRLPPVVLPGAAVALVLTFVARPVSVFFALAAASMSWRHKLLVSWVGLRGAVPIVLATFPLLAKLPRAELYFNLVFFVVIFSVLLQGTTIGWVARLLRLETSTPERARSPLEFDPVLRSSSGLEEIEITPESASIGRPLVDLRLPKTALVVLITRNDAYVIPRGDTVVERGDVLLVLGDKTDMTRVRERIAAG